MPDLGFAGVAPSMITPELTNLVWNDPYQKQLREQNAQLQQDKFDQAKQNKQFENIAKDRTLINTLTDPTKFSSGDAQVDAITNKNVAGLRTKYSQVIHDNPN